MVDGMSVVVKVMSSVMNAMSQPPALCNLSVEKLCKFFEIMMISACLS